MIIVYDKRVDAAYIYLTQDVNEKVAHTYPVDPEVGEIFIDVNDKGTIIGLDIGNASKKIPSHLFEDAIDIREFRSKWEKPETSS